jgi:hypothetical protein
VGVLEVLFRSEGKLVTRKELLPPADRTGMDYRFAP